MANAQLIGFDSAGALVRLRNRLGTDLTPDEPITNAELTAIRATLQATATEVSLGVIRVTDAAYGAIGNGVANDTAALTAAIAAAAAGSTKVVLLPAGTYKTNAQTVPAGVQLWFLPGAILSVNSGQTVTINGTLNVGLFQIFSGSGTVVLGSKILEVYPQWWGADNTGTTDSFAALQAAINAAVETDITQVDARTYSLRLKLPQGLYLTSAPLVIPPCIGLEIDGDGSVANSTTIQWTGADGTLNTGWMIDARSVLGFRIRNIMIIGQADISDLNSAQIANGIFTRRTGSAELYNSYNSWENVSVFRFTGIGIQFGDYDGYSGGVYPIDDAQTDNSLFENLYVQDCRIGIIINTINFLQCHFTRLHVFSYGAAQEGGGANPVDGSGNPVEDVNAAPIKFRMKTGVWVKYGHFSGDSIHVHAPFEDADAWSGYAFYVQDGSVNIISGYAEIWRMAYFDNALNANGTGGTTVKTVNSICNFDMYPGLAGGQYNAAKHAIYYAQSKVPLILNATDGIYVSEAANSAGVTAIGCRVTQPTISAMPWGASYTRNPKSSDIACTYFSLEEAVQSRTTIGRSGHLSSYETNELFIHPNLTPRQNAAGDRLYQFSANQSGNTNSTGLLLDSTGLSLYSSTFVNGASYNKATVMGTPPFAVSPTGAVTAGATTKLRTGTASDVTNAALELANSQMLSWKDSTGGYTNSGFIFYRNTHKLSLGAGNTTAGEFDVDATAGNTRFLLYDVNSGALKRVKSGANGTGPGGVGRALFIDNA